VEAAAERHRSHRSVDIGRVAPRSRVAARHQPRARPRERRSGTQRGDMPAQQGRAETREMACRGEDRLVESFDAELERALGDLEQIKSYYSKAGPSLGLKGKGGAYESRAVKSKGLGECGVGSGLVRNHTPLVPQAEREPPAVQKLNVAEAVIRKLYERNLKLESTLSELKTHTPKPIKAASPRAAPVRIKLEPRRDTSEGKSQESLLADLQEQFEKVQEQNVQLDAMIKARDTRIHGLEIKLEAAQNTAAKAKRDASRQSGISNTEAKRLQRRMREAEQSVEDSNSRLRFYKEQNESLLAAQNLRLGSKPDIKRLTASLTSQLDQQVLFADQERARYNTKLASLEDENSELFVQNKMYETQLEQVSQELEERDAVEAEIQEQMASIFAHMRQLESENARLRAAQVPEQAREQNV